MSQMYAWHPLVGKARTALDVWTHLIECEANELWTAVDGLEIHDNPLELMTAELFDATSWAALVVATDERMEA